MRLPGSPVARELAQALGDLGFSAVGLEDYLGPTAAAALARDSLVPVRRVLGERPSNLAVAIRLFLLADAVPESSVREALGEVRGWMDLLIQDRGQVRSVLELSPYEADGDDYLVAADWPVSRTGNPLAKNHVLGVGGASMLLAQCTVRPQVSAALDVGTGCGVQSFHLSAHATQVVATDVSARCVSIADFNFAMNGLEVSTRRGSLFDPVATESFDLIVSNPPFVIGAPSSRRHDYRDSGMRGDRLCGQLVHDVPGRLNPGGWFQMLANWEITDGDDWSANPRSWMVSSPLDGWVVERDVQDPASYVENWLHDAGDHAESGADQVYDTWLGELERRGVVGIGFGLVSLRAGLLDDPIRCFQHAPQPLVQPVGPDIERWFKANDLLREHAGAEVLLVPWLLAPDVEVIDEFVPGFPSHGRSVRRRSGFAWSGPIDPFGVRLLALADGRTLLSELILSMATSDGLDPTEVLVAAIPVVRQLVAEGFLVDPS